MLSCFIANEPGPEKRTAQGSSCSTTVCVCFHRPCTNCPCSMPRKGCAFDPQRGVLFHMHPPRLIPIGDDAARLLTILPPRPETSQHTTKTTVVSRPSLFLSLLSSAFKLTKVRREDSWAAQSHRDLHISLDSTRAMAGLGLARLGKELKMLTDEPPPGVCAWPVDDCITHLQAREYFRLTLCASL